MIYFLGIVGSLLIALSQLTLKVGANKYRGEGRIKLFFNPYSIVGYGSMLLITFLHLYIFKFLEIKELIIFRPLNYVFVAILSWLFLSEKFTRQKAIGIGLIAIGLFVFNLDHIL